MLYGAILCSHFIFKTCAPVLNIFVIKDFAQFDWFIFLAKNICKEKVETLSTILANCFQIRIISACSLNELIFFRFARINSASGNPPLELNIY